MIVAIIQARMNSTRLPGKSLASIEDVPLLAHVVGRTRRAQLLDQTIIATTDTSADDGIAALGSELHVDVFRGDGKDVLDRYYNAAIFSKADTIVRVTGDCPLHDPAVIDKSITHFQETKVEYCSGAANYPEGLDTEVFSFIGLKR